MSSRHSKRLELFNLERNMDPDAYLALLYTLASDLIVFDRDLLADLLQTIDRVSRSRLGIPLTLSGEIFLGKKISDVLEKLSTMIEAWSKKNIPAITEQSLRLKTVETVKDIMKEALEIFLIKHEYI